MQAEKVLEIVLREMMAYGVGWRLSWADFDGRVLKSQLSDLKDWGEKALESEKDLNYDEGSYFLKKQKEI